MLKQFVYGRDEISLYYSVVRPNRCTEKLVWCVPETLIQSWKELGNLHSVFHRVTLTIAAGSIKRNKQFS